MKKDKRSVEKEKVKEKQEEDKQTPEQKEKREAENQQYLENELVTKKIDEIYYVKKVCFEGIRGDKIIESGLFANSRSHNLKKIIIYDPKSFKVFSDYYLLKVN